MITDRPSCEFGRENRMASPDFHRLAYEHLVWLREHESCESNAPDLYPTAGIDVPKYFEHAISGVTLATAPIEPDAPLDDIDHLISSWTNDEEFILSVTCDTSPPRGFSLDSRSLCSSSLSSPSLSPSNLSWTFSSPESRPLSCTSTPSLVLSSDESGYSCDSQSVSYTSTPSWTPPELEQIDLPFYYSTSPSLSPLLELSPLADHSSLPDFGPLTPPPETVCPSSLLLDLRHEDYGALMTESSILGCNPTSPQEYSGSHAVCQWDWDKTARLSRMGAECSHSTELSSSSTTHDTQLRSDPSPPSRLGNFAAHTMSSHEKIPNRLPSGLEVKTPSHDPVSPNLHATHPLLSMSGPVREKHPRVISAIADALPRAYKPLPRSTPDRAQESAQPQAKPLQHPSTRKTLLPPSTLSIPALHTADPAAASVDYDNGDGTQGSWPVLDPAPAVDTEWASHRRSGRAKRSISYEEADDETEAGPSKRAKLCSAPPARSKSKPATNRSGPKKETFHCPYPFCNKTFTRNNDLGRHLRTAAIHNLPKGEDETGDETCPGCGMNLSREDSRKRHQKNGACGKRRTRRKPPHPAVIAAAELEAAGISFSA